jgi:predicted nucleic acid-binding protein
MIVLDASVAVDFLLRGQNRRPQLDMLRREDIHAPYLADVEVLHSLRRQSFLNSVEPERLEEMVSNLAGWKITFHPHRPYLKRVWSLRHRCTAYDAFYVALAEALGCPLLTADGHLARAVQGIIPVELV